MRAFLARSAGLTAVVTTLLVETGCGRLSQEPWWFSELVPDSPCYRVDLMDGVDEASTTELHDLYDCLDQGGMLASLQPLDTDLDFDTRSGDPIGIELARVLNHLPEVDIDPFAIGGVLLDALNAPDRPVDELLDTATEAIYGWRTAEVRDQSLQRDDPVALQAGLLAPLRPVLPVAATALLADGTGALDLAGDTLADPEAGEWLLTVSSVLSSEEPAIRQPLDPLLADLGVMVRETRTPGNDRWEAASGDSLRDVADFFVVRDNPVVDEISPAVADMLGDDVVLDALVPMIDELAAGDHLVPLPPEIGWLASVDTDGSPLTPAELSALTRFVRLLADNNHEVDCQILFFRWQLPNLAVSTLELIADMEPGEVVDLASVIESLTGNFVGELAFEAAIATCPTISPTAYDDLQVLETIQMPESEDVLVAFVALLQVLKHGQQDHIPAFADMAEALYDAGGLEPGEELIRDIAREKALTDVLTVLPVLVHPEEHGITAGGAPANDLADLLGIVRWAFVVDPETGLTGFQRTRPWMAPVLGEDGTWVTIGNLARTLDTPGTQLSRSLDLIPVLVDLDPDLVLLDQIATVLHDEELSLPLLRLLERDELIDDALADQPPPDAIDEVPLAFGGRLLLTGALEDVLRLVDLVIGAIPRLHDLEHGRTVNALEGWERRDFAHEGASREVYVRGEGPAVVVMHEVPNLHPGVIRFGQRLVDEGFRVWMPSLMGVPGRPVSVRTSLRSIGRACVSREFATWALGRTSPITVWLRALARHAGEGRPVGAIGMCLTGGFALAMAVDDVLAAPVLSQPSVPFALSPWHARDLGVSDEDLGTLRRRCADEGLCVLGLRFSMDAMAPGARFRRLREELGDAFLAVEIDSSLGNPHGIPPWHHSVLAHHYVDRPDHPTRQAEDRVVAFFRERLTADR